MKYFALVTLALSAAACGQISANSTSSPRSKLPLAVASAKGTLIKVMAIGGETTGYAVVNEAQELIEVDFKNLAERDVGLFVNAQVQVNGHMETRRGVEIQSHSVLVASDIHPMRQSCNGYFTGAVLNAFTMKCEASEFSGCADPFPYPSLSQCEKAAQTVVRH